MNMSVVLRSRFSSVAVSFTIILNPVIIPFLCSGAGSSHDMKTALELTAVMLVISGDPEGTT